MLQLFVLLLYSYCPVYGPIVSYSVTISGPLWYVLVQHAYILALMMLLKFGRGKQESSILFTSGLL